MKETHLVDTLVVVLYFVIVFFAGWRLSRKYSKLSTEEFLTGGKHMKWWQTGLTLIAMMVDPGIMGVSTLSFLFGFYVIQWNAINIWFAGWFSAMFFVTIYWRTKIVTTPEYLEKRFNVYTRGFFSLIMTAMIIAMMTYAVYMGALLLEELLVWPNWVTDRWPFWISVIVIGFVAGFYVIYGGMRAMLSMDIVQAIFLLLTVFTVGITGFVILGGFSGIKEMAQIGEAGVPLRSIIPPIDFSIASNKFFPLPAILSWALIAALSWIICNFSMAQRLLASKDENNAQKALIMGGIFNTLLMFMAYIAGMAARKVMPEVEPDKAFINIMFNYFPVGVRGLLVAGIISALLSTIDGLISSSSSLFTQDIYLKFINPNLKGKKLKKLIRIIDVIIILINFIVIPVYLNSRSAMEVIQRFMGDVMGVIIALFIVGTFFKRTTSWAAFFGMIIGTALALTLDFTTELNFGFIGTLSFVVTIVFSLIGSQFETPKTTKELENLTVWTIPDIKGPFIGLKSWPNLWKWALALPAVWILITLIWEWYMRS